MHQTPKHARLRRHVGTRSEMTRRSSAAALFVSVAVFSFYATAAPGLACPPEPCTSGWNPSFGSPGFGRAAALLIEGESLYAGGSFQIVPGDWPNPVVRWDGCTWHRVGGVEMVIEISAFCFAEELGNRVLHAAGNSGSTGRIMRFDGATWSTLGATFNDQVRTLAFLQGQLYAGGGFTQNAATTLRSIARWDGDRWNPLGAGLNDAVRTLAIHDDGGGEALYAGGGFFQSGAASAAFIARWDGANWSSVGGGANNLVACMTSYDDGNGAALYAGGRFSMVGGVSASGIARWQAGTWSALGAGLSGSEYPDVYALAGFQGMLYAGGSFNRAGGQAIPFIARWTGSTWEEVDGGINGGVGELVATEASSPFGPALYLSGSFNRIGGAGGIASNGLAQWTSCAAAPPCACSGDVDRSGRLDGLDVAAFVSCLTGAQTNCECADVDQSGTATPADIPAFVTRVVSAGGC